MLLMLECSRNVIELRKIWVQDYYKAKLKTRKTTVNGKTVGIIGCGNIGSRLAVRALGMEMNVLAYDPYKKADEFPEGVEVVRDPGIGFSRRAITFPCMCRIPQLPAVW